MFAPPQRSTLEATVAEVLQRHSDCDGALLPILHDLQAAFGYVPSDALPLVAIALNISRADLQGVVSFYHDFRDCPAEKPVVRLCRAEACQARGVDALAALATAQPNVDVVAVYCLGLCASGPAALIGDQLVGRLDQSTFVRLLDEVAA